MPCLDWHKQHYEALIHAKNALPHALLLHGPRGTGKLLFARAGSQALLCEAPLAGGYSCGSCPACSWFESGTHPDFRQVEPLSENSVGEEAEKKATTISVDQIRALADFVNMSSHRGGPKVVVIHPAETLNPNAANALLKNLEEPPPRTYFLLVSHRPHLLLPTIKSRCRQLALPAPDMEAAVAWLSGQGVSNPDVALAHTGNAPLLAYGLGKDYWGARSVFMRHILDPDFDVLAAAEGLRDVHPADVIAWLQKWSYDLVHYAVRRVVRYNPDYADGAARVASRVDRLDVIRFHREMVRLQRDANHPLNPKLFLESVLFAYRDLLRPPVLAAA